MKEIGASLKQAREEIGISIEEVAEDLKVKPSQVENIEAGNKDAFDDIYYLKYFIRDYAKYLGLDKEDMVDEFNEYLFDLTSRLSLDDIKESVKKKEKRVRSPYTQWHDHNLTYIPFLIFAIIVILVVGIIYFAHNLNDKSDDIPNGTVVEKEG